MINFAKRAIRKILNSAGSFKARLELSRLEKNKGYCPVCEAETVFIVYGPWLRDHYLCKRCRTIPRNRALINALNKFAPDWRKQSLHESSPQGAVSKFLKDKCADYSSSHYYADVPRGQYKDGHRSEDLSRLTFPDNSFDLLITSDVFEHVYEPDIAFKEIARVIKPGGMHIFTMPWYPELKKTVQRTKLRPDGTEEFLLEPVYHGNPIGGKGAIVTFDWGLDFTDFIFKHSGMTTTIYFETNRQNGIDGKFLEVFISRKAYAE